MMPLRDDLTLRLPVETSRKNHHNHLGNLKILHHKRRTIIAANVVERTEKGDGGIAIADDRIHLFFFEG